MDQDFVLDTDFNLDATFKSAFLRDIIKGLTFLHKSAIGYHGLLTAQNCLIDANWVLKLTQFGISTMIHEFVNADTLKPLELISLQTYHNFAPELLKNLEIGRNYPKGTVHGDIYSMGMILYQVLFRQPPYDRYMMSQREILDQIMNNNLQPEVHSEGDALLQIMQECWRPTPESRPKLRLINQTVQKAFVSATVAQVLKQGGLVPPRSYDSVTVLFCQIMDFNTLCSKSNAEQIVTFLNDTFTLFDEIVKVHDAYKVETTGETYMVASGVPTENGGTSRLRNC
ncbi:unnamed protein product, partial [Mesorhabditis spiculigera]